MAGQLEKLTADILDDEFVDIFRPIQRVHILFGCLRVQLKDGFATSPSKLIALYMTIVCVAQIYIQYINYTQCRYTEWTFYNEAHFKFAYIDINGMEIPLVIYEKFFTDEKRNCDMYVKLQKIDRHLNMGDRKKKNVCVAKFITYIIWFCLSLATLITIIFNMKILQNFCLPGLVVTWGPLITYFNGILIIVILHYISMRVDFVTKILEDINEINCEKKLKNSYPQNSILVKSLNSFDDKKWKDLLKSVHYVVSVISDFIYLYEHRILYIFVQTTLWALLYVERAILCLKYQTQLDIFLSAFLTLPVILLLFLMYIQCRAASYLTSKLEKLRMLSVRIIHSSKNETTRKYMKNMLLLLEVSSDLSIYDIVKIDTGLIGKLLVIIASYTMGLCYSSKFSN